MIFRFCFIIVLLINVLQSFSQQIIFGTNNYIEYQVGTLPIVISVPHGGNLEPLSIPDRTCNNAVNATDAYTIETAMEIKNSLFKLTGCYPHLIICHLKRNKLDCNRNSADGACDNNEAETAWLEYHNFITTARNTANLQYNYSTFFVDLHGHGNPIQRIELGYLLYDDELELSDYVLNTTKYINYSSIKNLALSNVHNYTHSELLRGAKSFGTLLATYNFPTVPSTGIPFPGTTTNYFSGGYITANHTCYASGVDINGVQMELNFTGVRDTPPNRLQFASAFSAVITDFINIHYAINWNFCKPLSINNQAPDNKLKLYPNPVTEGNMITLETGENGNISYDIFNTFGQKVKNGNCSNFVNKISLIDLKSGVYFIHLYPIDSNKKLIGKLIIQ